MPLCASQLRGAREHLDEVIMQRVVELTLELPGELGTLEVARMDLKNISVH